MKRIVSLALLVLLSLSLFACGETASTFNPQTPEECFDEMMEIFKEQTAYRKVCLANPEHPLDEKITDFVFKNPGSDEQIISGKIEGQSLEHSSEYYGEGNLIGKMTLIPTLKGSDANGHPIFENETHITYLQKQNGDPIEMFETSYGRFSLTSQAGEREQHLLNGWMKEYVNENATLEKKEDGSFVLTVPLDMTTTVKLYNKSPEKLYAYESVAVYTADRLGQLTSITHKATKEGLEQRDLEITLSYENLTTERPAWFNKEDPLATEATSVDLTYETEDGICYTLSEGKKGMQVEINTLENVKAIFVPDFLPEEAIYASYENLVFEEYNEKTKVERRGAAKIFYKKGARPADFEDKHGMIFFEGEWEMVDGVPTPKK